MTNDTHYYDAIMELGVDNEYFMNIVNAKIIPPVNVNYSDDELTFLPYLQFWFSVVVMAGGKAPFSDDIMRSFIQSIRRTWRYVKPERMSLYTYITALALGEAEVGSEGMNYAAAQLQRWPTELVGWQHTNSERWDLRMSPESDRFGHAISATIMPPDENFLTKWNGGPYDLDGGDSHSEDDCGGFAFG